MANQLETQLALASSLGLSELSKTAIMRGLFSLDGTQIKYSFRRTKSYQISDPEEKVRADAVAFLVLSKGYDSRKIDTEVEGSHNDFADIVLYEDDRCTKPWLVVENKKEGATPAERAEGEAQAFANGIALGAKYTMKDYGDESCVWQLEGFGARERRRNKLGDRELLPRNYSQDMVYPLHAGTEMDIKPASAFDISIAIRRAHSIIWAGGKRDPLSAFDEWSKLMSTSPTRLSPRGSTSCLATLRSKIRPFSRVMRKSSFRIARSPRSFASFRRFRSSIQIPTSSERPSRISSDRSSAEASVSISP